MKDLKKVFESVNIDFPDIKEFKTKTGITSIKWNCGNELCKKYLQYNLSGVVDVGTRLWFERNWDKMDTIVASIYKVHESIIGHIYFNYNIIGGRGIQFEGKFNSLKEAKTKMYEVLCKIRDDEKIFRKMSDALNANPDKYHYMGYDEFMSL